MNVEDGQDAIAGCHIKIALENEISSINHIRVRNSFIPLVRFRHVARELANVGSVTQAFLS